MKLTPRKNQYGHDVVDCPFCSYFAYVRPVTTVSPDPLRDLKRHITNRAKNEAFDRLLEGENAPASDLPPHFAYYKAHTEERKKVVPTVSRQYDDDLKI